MATAQLNPEAVPVTVNIESRLPEGWIPEGAGTWIIARRDNGAGSWEVLLPEFGIAGLGDSVDRAVVNAFELLDDYLVLCARAGKTYEESRRPISGRFIARILAQAIAAAARSKLRRGQGRPRPPRIWRSPVRALIAH